MESMFIYDLGSFPEWITSIVATIALFGVWVTYRDYSERTRPYIEVELETEINKDDETWSFLAKILNKGEYPVYTKFTNIELKVGDEIHPTVVDKEFTIFPGEEKIKIPVGYLYQLGREKIRQAKYTKNTVELEIEVVSRKLRHKKYKYKTYLKVQVLVQEDTPNFVLMEKRFE